jgi:hypothetical protein
MPSISTASLDGSKPGKFAHSTIETGNSRNTADEYSNGDGNYFMKETNEEVFSVVGKTAYHAKELLKDTNAQLEECKVILNEFMMVMIGR